MKTKILIIEDEEKFARFVEMELTYEGYEVSKAHHGRTGLEMAESGDYDLVLLDVMLPGLRDGGAAPPQAHVLRSRDHAYGATA